MKRPRPHPKGLLLLVAGGVPGCSSSRFSTGAAGRRGALRACTPSGSMVNPAPEPLLDPRRAGFLLGLPWGGSGAGFRSFPGRELRPPEPAEPEGGRLPA